LSLVIFENLQSVFEHPQHFLMFESLTSRDLKLGDPLTLRINNSTTFGYVPSGPCQVRFRFICHPPTITPFCVKRPQTKRLGTGFCESKEKAQGTPGRNRSNTGEEDSLTNRRFPHREGGGGQKLGYFYHEEERGRRSAAKMVAKDEARRIATKVAKLPELLPQSKLLVCYVK
jgi:hypothetical protein